MSPRPYATLLLLSVSHFLVDFMIGIWPVYKTMAGIDLAVAGLIYAVSATLGEGMQAFFGNMSDRGWTKHLVLGGLTFTLAGAFFAFTKEPSILFFIFLIICIGSGAFHPSAVSYVSRLTANKKSFYITHFAAFGSLGLAVSQIVYSYLYGALDGNTLYILIPTLAVILFTLKKEWIRSAPRLANEPPSPHIRLFLEFFKKKDLRFLYISQVCTQTILWSLVFLLPDVLKSRGYSDWIVYGGGHFVFIVGGVSMLIPSGVLADKFSSRSVILTATTIGTLFLYAFLLTPELADEYALVLLFVIGGSISVLNPVSIAFGHKIEPRHPGMVSAYLMGCVWCVSECIGPGGGGLLTKLFEEDAPARALMVIGTLFTLAVYSSYRLPKETRIEQTLSEDTNVEVA